jgi:CspA family cold shock protein
MNGTIKKLVSDKQFGFITGSDGKEYFFHKQDLVNQNEFRDLEVDMDEGQFIPVKFESVPSTKGPRAASVSRVIEGVSTSD